MTLTRTDQRMLATIMCLYAYYTDSIVVVMVKLLTTISKFQLFRFRFPFQFSISAFRFRFPFHPFPLAQFFLLSSESCMLCLPHYWQYGEYDINFIVLAILGIASKNCDVCISFNIDCYYYYNIIVA